MISAIFLIFITFPIGSRSQLIPQLLESLRGNGNGPGGNRMDLGRVIGDLASGISQGIGLNDADIIGDLRGSLTGSESDWSEKAQYFCRRYPGHPKCRRGQLPLLADIPGIINTVLHETGQLLPRVPKLNYNDPLTGLNSDLVGFIKNLQSQFGGLSPQQRNIIQNSCQNFKCNQQSAKNVEAKKIVMSKVLEAEADKDKVNLQFDRTLQVKQAMLKQANLSHIVVAADNGVFDRDLLLTEPQANFLLNELGQAGVGVDVPPKNGARMGRSALFFQENPVQKWDIWHPIPYTLDDSLEESDKQDVRNALHAISIKTCILFKYVEKPTGNHLNYMKVDSTTFCGLSYIGRKEPSNPIYLSFQCGDNRGVAMHETMHALGVNHQHLRLDRDKYIKVDWSNIDPQHYESFAIADGKLYSSYGTKYAYDSIMHYNAYLAAINPSKPTMTPLVDPAVNTPKLGQRAVLSWADIKLLKKMYCRIGCDDKNVHCGTWALNGYCTKKGNSIWMADNCKASCDKC